MSDFLSLFDNAALQGLGFLLAVLGLGVAFRVARYPDLTADGSFVLGSATFAFVLDSSSNWLVAFAAAALAGASAGALTSIFNLALGIGRLLTGILTSMICYSLVFRVSGGTPTMQLGAATMFSEARAFDRAHLTEWGAHVGQLTVLAATVLAVSLLVWVFLKSELGLVLRGAGANRALLVQMGRRTGVLQTLGLALANALIACAGALVSAQQGFVDLNLGIGVIIMLVAALVIGEAVLRIVPRWQGSVEGRFLAAAIGAFVYYLLYLIVLRASIRGWLPVAFEPTDLKMLSALAVALILALHRPKAKVDELIPV